MKIQSRLGNETLMQREKTAFVCSRKMPDGLECLVGKWLLGLSDGRDCIMCDNPRPTSVEDIEALYHKAF